MSRRGNRVGVVGSIPDEGAQYGQHFPQHTLALDAVQSTLLTDLTVGGGDRSAWVGVGGIF